MGNFHLPQQVAVSVSPPAPAVDEEEETDDYDEDAAVLATSSTSPVCCFFFTDFIISLFKAIKQSLICVVSSSDVTSSANCQSTPALYSSRSGLRRGGDRLGRRLHRE